MASEKTKSWAVALLHATTYAFPFLFLRPSLVALAVIIGTHALIDRYRLARFVCWAKNCLSPSGTWQPWSVCTGTGYPPERPPWMAVWLLIIADNVMHVLINAAALDWLR